jgi:glycosyltransferase involved in cell wall biosynthesis
MNFLDYLNRIKLLVLPSYYEGLPNIVLEAMACGTPVLSTPVGAVADIISNNETGFIMADNQPQEIAANILHALKHPNLQVISQNANAFVQAEYSYEAMTAKYNELLSNFSSILYILKIYIIVIR